MKVAINAESENHARLLRRRLRGMANTLKVKVRGRPLRTNDASDLMPQVFALRQIAHVQTIDRLGRNNDVGLIVRSMLEGMINALWVQKVWPERAVQWHNYVLVHDWRLQESGIREDPTSENIQANAELEETMNAIGSHEMFLMPKVRRSVASGNSLPPDPYVTGWRDGKKLKETWQEVEGDAHQVGGGRFTGGSAAYLYDNVYDQLSAWHHWDTTGFGRIFDQQAYPPYSMRFLLGNLITAFYSLLGVAEFADRRLSLGVGSDLERQTDVFVNEVALFAAKLAR